MRTNVEGGGGLARHLIYADLSLRGRGVGVGGLIWSRGEQPWVLTLSEHQGVPGGGLGVEGAEVAILNSLSATDHTPPPNTPHHPSPPAQLPIRSAPSASLHTNSPSRQP